MERTRRHAQVSARYGAHEARRTVLARTSLAAIAIALCGCGRTELRVGRFDAAPVSDAQTDNAADVRRDDVVDVQDHTCDWASIGPVVRLTDPPGNARFGSIATTTTNVWLA